RQHGEPAGIDRGDHPRTERKGEVAADHATPRFSNRARTPTNVTALSALRQSGRGVSRSAGGRLGPGFRSAGCRSGPGFPTDRFDRPGLADRCPDPSVAVWWWVRLTR